MKILVTGAAGFIGYHTVKQALKLGHEIVGIDNLNSYYDVSLKKARLAQLGIQLDDPLFAHSENFQFHKMDLIEYEKLLGLFEKEKFDVVLHLAAQAGVRYSMEEPHQYIKSNIDGFLNILEACRHHPVKHLIYASSSSVYGQNAKIPFSPEDAVDHPISLYAATKRSNELMAHTYSHLFNIPTTGLRFFTVYGPWGRPDMAPFLFTNAILNKKPIKVFNHGKMERDFTYVEDIVEAQLKLLEAPLPKPTSSTKPNQAAAPFRIFNIGNSSPVSLMEFIGLIEKHTGVTAQKEMYPMQAGDVSRTYADVEDLFSLINYRPTTSLDTGVEKFVSWYKDYYS